MKFCPVVPGARKERRIRRIRIIIIRNEFSRCLPFSKWLPKHSIKMGDKNSTFSDIIKI
jgi:hypothetical protein